MTVQLPAGSRVEAKAASAEFRGVGRLGDVAFEGAHGAIKLDEAASARLTIHAGDVSVGRLSGPARDQHQQGRHPHRRGRARHGRAAHRGRRRSRSAPPRGVSASLDAGTSYGRIHNALKNTDGARRPDIHATTAYGDITARSL